MWSWRGAYRSNADAVRELVICSDVVQTLADSPRPQLLHMPRLVGVKNTCNGGGGRNGMHPLAHTLTHTHTHTHSYTHTHTHTHTLTHTHTHTLTHTHTYTLTVTPVQHSAVWCVVCTYLQGQHYSSVKPS